MQENSQFSFNSPSPADSGQQQEIFPPVKPPRGFWSRHNKTIIRLIIIAVVIGAAFIYSHTQQKRQLNDNQKDASQILEQIEQGDGKINITENNQENLKVKVMQPNNSQTVNTNEEKIAVTVQRSEGYTHLARRALAAYLQDNPNSNLKPEQKIYIEDYVQKKIADKPHLYAGDKIEISKDLLQEAIGKALQLTPRQITNLHQYSVLVPSL